MNQPESPNAPTTHDFLGVYSDSDPRDVPDGYLLRQLNLYCEKNGQLTTRGALRTIRLETLE